MTKRDRRTLRLQPSEDLGENAITDTRYFWNLNVTVPASMLRFSSCHGCSDG